MIATLLDNKKGAVIAPAGCGKTHLLTNILGYTQPKPYLVLTHTTAGVSALKKRLSTLNIPPKNFIVTTIDGWCMKFANSFINACPIKSSIEDPRNFYPEIRNVVLNYLSSGAVDEIFKSTYSRVLVDEYQDCDFNQHSIICALALILPTTIFGDPMQRIFNFRGVRLPSWEQEVLLSFPLIFELNIPYRWRNSGADILGDWLLQSRITLSNGHQIDLTTCPGYVNWFPLTGNERQDQKKQIDTQYQIRKNNNDTLLIIGNPYRAESRHNFASSVKGIDVVETVDLRDVVLVAKTLDGYSGRDCLDKFLTIIATMISGTERSKLRQRFDSISNGRNRTPPTKIELAYINAVNTYSAENIYNLINTLEDCPNTRVFRTSAFSAVQDMLQTKTSLPESSFLQSAEKVREIRRHTGERRIPFRAIGSTLLLKGLEADHVLIQDAGNMNSQNLYVALSRGAKSITVFSKSPIVG